jgi:hypothetical protein
MFKSPDQALAFAFRLRETSVVSLPSGTYIANKTDNQHSTDRLTQYDMHAQSGMIFAWLSRRPEDEQIYAFFLHGNNRERRQAASLLIRRNQEVFKKYKLQNHKLRSAVLGRSVRDVSDTSGLTQYKAWKFRQDLADIFQPIQDRLMESMYEEVIAKQVLDL